MTCPNEPSSYKTGKQELQVRTKSNMRGKLLRSVLVATCSVVAALVAWSGVSGAKGDVQANTSWPSVAVDTVEGTGS
jgi:hypothetical protein